MAIRKIRYIGDEILKKKCKPVKNMTPSIETLIEDMFDTMYEANGVGLAAPQVGILRRVCVVDVRDEEPIVLINPEILETSGEQTDDEGCLSVPGKVAEVTSFMRWTIWTVFFTASGPANLTEIWKKRKSGKKNESNIYGNAGVFRPDSGSVDRSS